MYDQAERLSEGIYPGVKDTFHGRSYPAASMAATHDPLPADSAVQSEVDLRLRGELDAATVDATTATIARAVATGAAAVALDLGEVSFIDSSGLRSIVLARSAGEERGCCVWIARTSSAVRRLLDLTGLMMLTVPPGTPSR